MDKQVIVILADGFEEMEAIITIDILRRAGLQVASAAIGNELLVTGSRHVQIKADVMLKNIQTIPEALILPGGGRGAKNLALSEAVITLITKTFKAGKIIAAICASPAHALVKAGVLDGRRATCYPGEEILFSEKTVYEQDDVVIDGNIITSRGPGTAFNFALAIVEALCGKNIAIDVKNKALIT